MPMRSAASVAAAEAAHPERARFYADLVNGLHAMAQPLTILRSAMEMLTLPNGGMIDQRRYLEMSSRQVARTCGMFASLQDLVETQLIEAQRVRFDLWDLLMPLIENQRRMLGDTRIEIIAARPESRVAVWGDAGRTEQALAAVLKLAGAVSISGDVIELRAVKADGYMELTCENARRHGKPMDSSERLSLAVAEANILSQNGRYDAVEDPFRVSLALPVENLDRVIGEVRLSPMRSQPMN
ncbi:MAG TPA: hypothetical protein VHX37_01820 [Acidobacteriaceae bacterium]|nr:hypothetical protein [Acidobacteriaceae bacterium]